MACSVHGPSAGGARFTGRTDPLSRGAGYISSGSYARRGQLVTTDGELRRPTSSRCTDGDATTAPVPRVPKSPFRLAASRPIVLNTPPLGTSATRLCACKWRALTDRHRFFWFGVRTSPRLFIKRRSRVLRRGTRQYLPRDQFSGPWLFSTAEARTSNSSSSRTRQAALDKPRVHDGQ